MNYIFFDIETHYKTEFSDLDVETQKLFADYVQDSQKDPTPIDLQWNKTAGLKPEFGEIVCISAVVIKKFGLDLKDFSDFEFATKSFGVDDYKDEKVVLDEFNEFLNAAERSKISYGISGYNIKNFDIPFVLKRCIKNGITPSNLLTRDIDDKWGKNQTTLDVMDLYKMGAQRAEKLAVATRLFGIKSKTESEYDGKYLHTHTYDDIIKNINDRIIPYCEEDTISTAKLFCCLKYFRAKDGLI